MRTLAEQTPEFEKSNLRCLELVSLLTSKISPETARRKIPSNRTMYPEVASKEKLYILKEGALSYNRDGRFLFFFEEGDLIGLENHYGGENIVIQSDFAVLVDEYDAKSFFKAVSDSKELQDLWNEYSALQLSIFSSLAASLVRDTTNHTPDFRMFESGDIIIKQGSPATEVYTLVEGHADVFVDDVKVGEILRDEVFGTLAALTDTPRIATVVATESCMVLSLPKENFTQLVQNRPHTVFKMVQDMARAIVSLNSKVVDLTCKKL